MLYARPLLLSAALLLTAAPLLAQTAHPETGEPLAADQTFTYRLLDQFPTLDPHLNEETAGFHVIRQIFEGLMTQDAEGNLAPGVATAVTANDDNTVYTFALRPEARWSNGDPVTAHDFVYGWRRAADPATASPYAWYVELTSIANAAEIVAGDAAPDTLGVTALDDHTLQVTLTQPLPYFPAMTTYATLFPAHRATIEAHGADWTKPENIVGNGAYTLQDIALNEFFRLAKSETYWDAAGTVVTEVTGLVINDDNQALTRYRAGELDHLEPLPAGQYPALLAEMPDQATSVPRLCSYYYTFNHTESGEPALRDARVRTALSYAIDRDVIVNAVLKGGQKPAYNFTHWATAGFESPLIEYATWDQAERDARAKALWEEVTAEGIVPAGGLTLDLIYNTSESHKQIATVVSQMWKQKLGVETTLSNFEWQTYLEIRGEQKFDIARSAWCGDYNEASTFLDLLRSDNPSNDGRFGNETYDAIMAASKTAADPQPNYTQAEQILAADMAIAPVYHYANTFLLRADIKGWPYGNVENNWYVKDFYRVAAE